MGDSSLERCNCGNTSSLPSLGTALLVCKSVVTRGSRRRMRLYGVRSVLWWTSVLFAYASGCTKVSLSFRCLAMQCRIRVKIVLFYLSAWSLVWSWYTVVMMCLTSRKLHNIAKHLLWSRAQFLTWKYVWLPCITCHWENKRSITCVNVALEVIIARDNLK